MLNFTGPVTIFINADLSQVLSKLDQIIMTEAELAQKLTETTAQVQKIGTETQTLIDKVAELTELLANGDEVSPEVQAAMDALSAQVGVVDGLVADITPPEGGGTEG